MNVDGGSVMAADPSLCCAATMEASENMYYPFSSHYLGFDLLWVQFVLGSN
jgi:hypothetical protein